MFNTIWTLGLWAILHDGDSFCVTYGNPHDFPRADIVFVKPTMIAALDALKVEASRRAA